MAKMEKGLIDSNHVEDMLRLMRSNFSLTNSELRILALVERGLTSREIANLLGCSTRNIENHRYRIGKKRRSNQ